MKDKLNYKLLNLLILVGIVYLFYSLKDIVLVVLSYLVKILKPFVIAFAMAYAVYPLLRYMERKKVPKPIGIIFILTIICALLTVVIISMIPIVTTQIGTLFSSVMKFFTNLDNVFSIDLTSIKASIASEFNKITGDMGKYISNGAVSFVNASINFVSLLVIVVVAFIYFLADMDKIRSEVKLFCKKKGKKTLKLVKEIDFELIQYIKGLSLCIFIQFVEYTALFYIIGHPNFLLLGVLASVTQVIPYFGGLIANIIAVISASVISPKLLILTLIIAFVCPNIDGYLIAPRVYGKTNQLSPFLSIFAVFAGGVIGGIIGILIALPLTIIFKTLYKNYKNNIIKTLEEIKEMI